MIAPLLSLAALASFSPSPPYQEIEPDIAQATGSFVLCLTSAEAGGAFDLDDVVRDWNLPRLAPALGEVQTRELFAWTRRDEVVVTHVVLVEFDREEFDHSKLRAALATRPEVRWAVPNRLYTGDPRERGSNDPQFAAQYHHVLMQNDLAWTMTLGTPDTVIGITDDGIETDHEDLAAGLWVNVGEIPGDGIDNEGNGYVDDVHGVDLIEGDGDPNPTGGDEHGTHVSGIAGARTNNGIGVAGTAGGATIMPVKFFTSGQTWTAALVAEAFAYAVDNGARIVVTSYDMDQWATDPVVAAAFDYLYDSGALHINSAGNGNVLEPPRQTFHQTLFVASTNANDERSPTSNHGTGIDLSAPGVAILSTLLNDGYGSRSGTSMAAPNAAGVAALVWSLHPSWSRDQVAAQLVATTDDIDSRNPGYEGLLGSGRVNALRALTETLPPPIVASAEGLPDDGGSLMGELDSFVLRFDQILSPASVAAPNAFRLRSRGPDLVFDTADDVDVPLAWSEYLVGSNRVTFVVLGTFPVADTYRVTASANVLANPFGTALDGNGDGVPGDPWTRTFDACEVTVVALDNAESGVDWSVENQNVLGGAWTRAPEVPVGGGARRDPPEDFDGSGRCFLTENVAGNSDVDGGPTRLTSRAFDLDGTVDPRIGFAAWMNTSGDDVMEVDVSDDDGATWIPVMVVEGAETWRTHAFRLTDFAAPTNEVRLRFSVEDTAPPSVTEAAIDFLRVTEIDCDRESSLGEPYCTLVPNSSGNPAAIAASGSAVVQENDLELAVTGLPPGQFGLFFFGPDALQTPSGDGFLCVGGSLVRLFPPSLADSMGMVRESVDLGPHAGAIAPGLTSRFQFWFRDVPAGNTGYGFSNAVRIDWM